MDSALGSEKKKHVRAVDLLLLAMAALIVAAVLTAAFWLAEARHINPGWLFAGGAGLIFFFVVGWGYRRKLRDPDFAFFFGAWTLVHVLVYLGVLAFWGFLYYIPAVIVELWVGYTIAIWKFGPPPDPHIR